MNYSSVFSYYWLAICAILFHATAWSIEADVEGVEQSEIEENIRLHLNNLDVETNALTDPYWQEEINRTVATAVEPFGYYNSQAKVEIDDDTVIVHVNLDTPLIVANVTREIIGPGRADEAFHKQFNNFPLQQGDVLHQPEYESFKTSMFNYALSHGYFDFSWQATRLDLVREDREANILLIAQSGPQYQFGQLKLVGEDKSEAILERLKPFTEGEPYSSITLTNYNRRLNQSGYFSRVIARPVVSEAENLKVPVEITLVHKPKDSFNVGLGAATDTGPRLRLRWERPWVNSRGHSISSELFISSPEQSLTVDYRIPMQDITRDYLSIEAGYQFIEYSNSDTEAETFSVAAHRYWQESDSPWQRDGSLTYLKETYIQGSDDEQTTQLIMPGYALRYLDRDDRLNVTKGTYFQVFSQVGQEGLGSDIDIVKAVIEGGIIRTYKKHWLMMRAEAGAIKTNDFDSVPASLRFFAGGDQSIRGFAYRDISPKDTVTNLETGEEESDVSVGGKYLATAGIEYAYRVAENWRAALFMDAGTATNDFDQDIAYGFGTGFHWLSPIGPVRVYAARGISDYENSWRIHFMIGPAL
ncbi:autotransporter assembly complex family protein [Alteromonas sp. C1M14]|uniref:autotransporter assembly complex protein TamA n=1 Tax=Alteromonas sp. C1M14 TaxID=2841567 RepID=UPI001C0A3618|nr:autotransporter assembly complex family protein [Alteromonas sp. C1M14]MBU2978391.1 autotransporter assembly complex protein TamA [Alteromonas sp. C1M14]